MPQDTRPGPQAQYSKHIVSSTDDKNVQDQRQLDSLRDENERLRNALEAAANVLEGACEYYSAQIARDVLNKIQA